MSGGGSGGGSSGVKYDNLEQLYGTQQQAANFMLDQAMPRVPGLLNNSQSMVDEAMSGALGQRARNTAMSDANAASAASNADQLRNLYSMGALGDPSGERFLDVSNRNALSTAAMRSGAMNKAGQWAEDQKWNRNANMFGQVMGMNSGAMAGLGQAGSGMSGIAGMQNQNDAANAKGYGQAGAAFGSAMMKADGGYIHAARLADGGDAWTAYKTANPVRGGGLRRGKGTNPVAAMLGGAAPSMAGAAVKDIFKGDKSKIVGGLKDTYSKYQANQTTPTESYIDSGGIGAGYDPGLYSGAGEYGYDTYSAVGGMSDAMDAGNAAFVGSEAATAGAAAADAASWAEGFGTAADVSDGVAMFLADGGAVKRNAYALGGLASSGMAKSGIASNDASNSMQVAKLDDFKAAPVQQADPNARGKTDGMMETSSNDPDGFGKHYADNRHSIGKASLMTVSGMFTGSTLPGSIAAEILHPIGQAATRNVVNLGDKLGGVAGAMALDPIATTASGKYSPKEILTLGLSRADGGRVDHRAGGEVDGPGTETSDDIPAWLSDGEFVLNAEAVKMIGRDKLDKLNNAGLKRREGKPAPKGKGKGLKLSKGGMAKRKGC